MTSAAAVDRRDARAPLAIAIDVGSSSTRVVAFDARARRIAGSLTRVRHEIGGDREGGATLDADAVVAATTTCLDGTLRRLGRRSAEVGVVATSVFWHSLVGVDARGRAVTPVYTWADMRARSAAAALRSELDPAAFHERTGCYLHATYPAVKLRWLRETQGRAFERAVQWLSLGEYLALRFTGAACSSHSIASATGLYDQGTRRWDEITLQAVGLAPTALPAISDAPLGALRAAFARRWPTLTQAVWLPALGDGAVANVGSGCATAGRAAVSLGTSGAVRACYRAARAAAPAGLWEYRLDERYVVVGGAVNNGWNAIAWADDVLGATSGSARGELTVLPFFSGERTPWWDDAASGAITGIRLSTTRADIARAVVESVMVRLAAAGVTLVEAHPAIARFIASGGAFAARPELAQIVADVLQEPVGLAADAEASAAGAAIVGLARIGVLGSIETAPVVTKTYRPHRAAGARYAALLEGQVRLHEALVASRL